jgi:hypothetical protein
MLVEYESLVRIFPYCPCDNADLIQNSSINDPKQIFEQIMAERYYDLLRFKPRMEDSYKHGLEKEFDPVMQCIWNIRSNISASLPSLRGHSMPIIKDYKEALARLEENFEKVEANLQ